MKIYIMTNTEEQLVIDKGFKIAERFRKNRETGEKNYFPVGIYDEAKAHIQYFFLNKSLHEKIKTEHLDRIDHVIFKPHNNIPNYFIAFPNRKDTSAMLLFNGFSKDSITFIDNLTGKEKCPYQSIPSKEYRFDEEANCYVCPYCGSKGHLIQEGEETEFNFNPNIPPQSLIGTFVHEEEGTVNIYKKSETTFSKFLDANVVNLEDNSTISFLYNKDYETQYIIIFKYSSEEDYTLDVTCPSVKGYTAEQFVRQVNKANNYEKRLIESQDNGPTVYKFPSNHTTDNFEGPFAELLKVKDQFTTEEPQKETEVINIPEEAVQIDTTTTSTDTTSAEV